MHHNFSQVRFLKKITSAFLKTGINLRNLPPAHSRGAVTFSVLSLRITYTDQDAKRLLRNKKKMKVSKLTALLNFQGYTQDYQDHLKIGPKGPVIKYLVGWAGENMDGP